MPADLQATLLQLFEQMQRDPDSMPAVPLDDWQAGSEEWRLLDSFRGMVEQIQQRLQQLQQAEVQLREREGQYRSIFEATTDALTIASLEDGRIVEVNPAECKMLGYRYEELIGLTAETLVHPDSLPLVREGFERFREAGRNDVPQIFLLRKDGTSFLVEAHSTQFTYKGKPHLLTISRDVTERVEAERQVREREEQYRSVFETTYDGMMITDLESGCYVEVNPAFCRMFGYPREDLIGMHSSILAAPLDRPLVDDVLEDLRGEGGYRAVIGQGLRKDGTSFYVESQGTTFTYRGHPHALAVVRDITKQVEAERQLREREALYRGIFETTYDAVAIFDLEASLVEANPAFCQLLGYPREELIGMPARALVAPDSQARLTNLLEALQAGRSYQGGTGRGLHKDGTVFPYEAINSPIPYRGQPHILTVLRDITEQVAAQQLLEQRVQERTREISTLLEISRTVTSTLHLEPLLGLILEQLQGVVDCTSASVLTVEGDESVVVATRGPDAEQRRSAPRLRVNQGTIWERLLRGEAVIIDDVRDETPLAQDYRQVVGDLLETAFKHTHAWMGVPMILKDQVSGLLSLSSSEVGVFTAHHATLAQAVANQAAIAIANARLYEQAQALAALEERQKLARELHDSVSQALYGIALGAHSARTALQRDPGHVTEPLDYVLSLAEAGLAEMRALIFELRPESLETEGLVSALTKQGNALQARHELRVHLDLCDEPSLPLPIKQELYRIAQEAMHNTVKHARARTVDLRLYQTNEAALLEIRDDGVGFDSQEAFPGHLGLHSMRERVASLGGTLQIESAPGQGTQICVQVPLQPPT